MTQSYQAPTSCDRFPLVINPLIHSGRFGSAQALVLQFRLCTDPVYKFSSLLLLAQGTASRFTKSPLLSETNEVTLRSRIMSYVWRKRRQSGAHKFTKAVSFHTTRPEVFKVQWWTRLCVSAPFVCRVVRPYRSWVIVTYGPRTMLFFSPQDYVILSRESRDNPSHTLILDLTIRWSCRELTLAPQWSVFTPTSRHSGT